MWIYLEAVENVFLSRHCFSLTCAMFCDYAPTGMVGNSRRSTLLRPFASPGVNFE